MHRKYPPERHASHRTRGPGLSAPATALAILLLPLASQARSEPPREGRDLFQGIRYHHEHRTEPRPLNIRVLTVNLRAEGIRFAVTAPNPARTGPKDAVILKRTTALAKELKAQVAVNGTFFFADKKPWTAGAGAGVSYLAVYDGTVYSERRHEDEVLLCWSGRGLELWVQPGAAPWTFKPGDGQMALGMARWALLLRDGKSVAPAGKDQAPRTAIGVTKERDQAFLIVVDGRQKGRSEGVTLAELAGLLAELGAHEAINLDGGGSTTMVAQQPDGTYKILNRPSDLYPLSVERAVGTHLVVYAKKLPE